MDSFRDQSSFHQFSSLPTEIRIKIWSYSSTPRLLFLESNDITISTESGQKYFDRIIPSKYTPLPPLLLVNREARMVGQELYHKAFQYTAVHSLVPEEARYTYINFDIDVISMWMCDVRDIPDLENLKLKYLIIRTGDPESFHTADYGSRAYQGPFNLLEMEKLEDLTVTLTLTDAELGGRSLPMGLYHSWLCHEFEKERGRVGKPRIMYLLEEKELRGAFDGEEMFGTALLWDEFVRSVEEEEDDASA